MIRRLRDLLAHARAGHRLARRWWDGHEIPVCRHCEEVERIGRVRKRLSARPDTLHIADPPARSPVDAARERGDL